VVFVHGFTPISIAGALTSLIVTPLILFAVFQARKTGEFRRWIYLGPLLFETGFLVAYMTALSFQTARTESTPSAADAWLGAIHGISALLVFIGFWALFPLAISQYRRGRNLFAERPVLTWAASALRVLTLLTGESIFVLHWVV
jgi:hypothetical protein